MGFCKAVLYWIEGKTEARGRNSLLSSIQIECVICIHLLNTQSTVKPHLSEYGFKVIICPGLSLNGLCMTLEERIFSVNGSCKLQHKHCLELI